MVSQAFAALTKKRADLAEKEKGFTLIELLVVVIIIGVLAAIAIPIYLNVQGGAKDSAVKSDLTNAKVAVSASQTTTANGALPANDAAFKVISPAPADGNYKVAGTTLTYSVTADGKGFCIAAVSASDKLFAITDKNSVTEGKTCSAGVMS